MKNPTQPTAPTEQSWTFAEDHVPMSEAVRSARDEAILGTQSPISPGVVALLTAITKAMGATAVVEVGTQFGVSGVTFLEAMGEAGILTSIDSDADNQLSARKVFQDAGFPTSKFRLIAGSPIEVLGKLRDGAYDIMFVNGDKLETVEYVASASRLLRSGGVLILNDALWFNKIADEDDEGDETIILREAMEAITMSEEYSQSLVPVGNGLLLAVRD